MKKRQFRHIKGFYETFLFLLVLQGPVCADDSPAAMPLSEVLPGNYHRSNYYRINDFVINDNNYIFTVESDYGKFRIESVGLTLKYLRETDIVGQVMNQYTSSKSHDVDLQSQLRISADSAVDILASPLGTASNLAGQLARNLGDTFAGNSPYVIHESRLGDADETDPNLQIHKRNISNQLYLDVYTSNNIVQNMLALLARERSAGNISSGSVLVNVNDGYEKKVSNGGLDREINSIIRKYTVEELYQYNSGILGNLEIPVSISENFLMHASFSPSLQTTIIKYLEFLYGVKNRKEFLALSLLAKDEVTAYSFARILKMAAWYTENIETVNDIKLIGTKVSLITETNHQLIVYPDDVFYLNEAGTGLLEHINERSRINKYSGITLIAYGSISDMAKSAMLDSDMDYYEYFLFE